MAGIGRAIASFPTIPLERTYGRKRNHSTGIQRVEPGVNPVAGSHGPGLLIWLDERDKYGPW